MFSIYKQIKITVTDLLCHALEIQLSDGMNQLGFCRNTRFISSVEHENVFAQNAVF